MRFIDMCLHPSPELYFTGRTPGHVSDPDMRRVIYDLLNAAACVAVNNWQAITKGWTTADSGTWTNTRNTLMRRIHARRYIDRWPDGQTQAVKPPHPSSPTQPRGELMWFDSHLESDALP